MTTQAGGGAASGGTGATTTTTAVAVTGGGSCPDARYCPKYALDRRWKPDSQGRVVIHYRINPTVPPNTALTPQQIIDAINAGAAAWMAADPKVVLVYDGTTTDPPVGGKNIVGFSANYSSGVVNYPVHQGTYVEAFDLIMDSKVAWDWRPCQPPETPCDEYESNKSQDFQDVVTHEWGHVVGLGHVDDEVTMNPADGRSRVGLLSRRRVTLGLGDVLGLRKHYPCDCPMPTIYRP